jgi:hypothetical protein
MLLSFLTKEESQQKRATNTSFLLRQEGQIKLNLMILSLRNSCPAAHYVFCGEHRSKDAVSIRAKIKKNHFIRDGFCILTNLSVLTL